MTRDSAPFLPAYAGFAAVLSGAGLPIYIHAPKVYADSYGVGVAALGFVLGGLRLIDVVQDPALGWLSGRLRRHRGAVMGAAGALMAAAMIALFAVSPPVAPLLWFALCLTVLFSAFSFLSIAFYAEGVGAAGRLGAGGHVEIATWRESGSLAGVSLAALAPAALAFGTDAPFAAYAILFAGLTLLALIGMRTEWRGAEDVYDTAWLSVLKDRPARRLLLVALVNAAPVAVTSTLFLFFVDLRLGAPEWSGPLLLLFFAAAAGSVPGWGALARRIGAKRALQTGMILSVLAFGWAALLGRGDVAAFAAVCIASGVATGADFTLLPALFARRLARSSTNPAGAFGLWSFVSKLSLALAAVTVLPVLEASGLTPGSNQIPERTLVYLTGLYAGLPCILKIAAIALLSLTPVEED